MLELSFFHHCCVSQLWWQGGVRRIRCTLALPILKCLVLVHYLYLVIFMCCFPLLVAIRRAVVFCTTGVVNYPGGYIFLVQSLCIFSAHSCD